MTSLGQIDLAVKFSDDFASQTKVVTFDVVQKQYQYNAILSRATRNTFGVIAHHNNLCIKILAPEGIVTV